ncbi:predicted protein [Botrytis cinerea T4]|uniref:Uncharacterized protein n=1 Tax=Botryotinia fuckeliana (strain T4) TaxID=999810 RepID=G2YS83_BOTF4|nr:predicted protein [Botrytis cinerea T4]
MLHWMIDCGDSPKCELNAKRFTKATEDQFTTEIGCRAAVPEHISNATAIRVMEFWTLTLNNLGRSDCIY